MLAGVVGSVADLGGGRANRGESQLQEQGRVKNDREVIASHKSALHAFQSVHHCLEFGPRLQSFDVRVFLDLIASLRAAVDGLTHEQDGAAEVSTCQPTAFGLWQLGVCLDLRDHLSEDGAASRHAWPRSEAGTTLGSSIASAAASLKAPSLRSILASASKWPPSSVRTLSRFLLSRMACRCCATAVAIAFLASVGLPVSSSKVPCPSRTIPKWLCKSIAFGASATSFSNMAADSGEERRCVGETVELEEIIAQVVLGDCDVVSLLEGGRRAVSEALEDRQSSAQAFFRFWPTNFALHLAQVVEHAGLHAQPLRGRG